MASEFGIHDDDDKASDGEEDDDVNATDGEEEWVMKPTKSRETIWHRYQNPENRKIWFACITVPALWCYESEVRPQVHKDDVSFFLFQGKWQKVEDPPRCEMTAASSTAAIKPREMIWHRYQNPENREMWFACVTLPGLWCYESEVRPQVHEDGTSCFLFHGKLQKVEDAQPCEMMAARSTAAIQPNTTDGSGAPACTRGETLT